MTATVPPQTSALRAVCSAHTNYLAGCDDCRAAGAARARTRTRLIAYGRWEGLVDSADVVAHIARLIETGMSRNAIARQAKVAETVVCRLATGVQMTAHSTTARKILAVQPSLPPHASVNSLGAARRLQALMAAGWDSPTLAPLLDTSVNQLRRWRWQSQPTMRFDVHQRIARLYRAVGGPPGTFGRGTRAGREARLRRPYPLGRRRRHRQPRRTAERADPEGGGLMAGCVEHMQSGQAGCAGCRASWRRYDQRRRARIADGSWLPRVSPDAARQHITRLRQAGMSLAAIAAAAGVHKRTLQHLGKRRWLTGETSAAILAVEPVEQVRAGYVPSIGTARRVQALAAIGWSFVDQGRALGVTNTSVWELAHQVFPTVAVTTHDRVVAMFERLSATPGGSARARILAQRKGWLPPLAWDDLDAGTRPDVDGDSGVIDETVIERALSGERVELTDAELLSAARIGAARGMSPWALAGVLHMNVFGVRTLLAGELPPRRAKRAARAGQVAS